MMKGESMLWLIFLLIRIRNCLPIRRDLKIISIKFRVYIQSVPVLLPDITVQSLNSSLTLLQVNLTSLLFT